MYIVKKAPRRKLLCITALESCRPYARYSYFSTRSKRSLTTSGDLEDALPDRIDEVCHIVKNLAIDMSLARSIFYAISSSKAHGSQPLEWLALRMNALTNQSGARNDSPLICLLWYIGRSWACTASIDSMHQCDVEEYEFKDKGLREEYDEYGDLAYVLRSPCVSVMHRVWPRSRDEPFKDVWHSMPLCDEGLPLDDLSLTR